MSVVTGYGEKVSVVPSVDGDVDVVAPVPVSVVGGQVVVRGEKVRVVVLSPVLGVGTTVHDSMVKEGRGVETVLGDAVLRPSVARSRFMVVAPIHDKPCRPGFVVNLGDVEYRPPAPRPWLGLSPISVVGDSHGVVLVVPQTYRFPEADIHGFRCEESKPETSVVWEHPLINAKIHDFSRRIAM